ncbi:MAG: LA_2272 family surface repeat-containing protein [Bacteroidota bacterium]
MGIINKTKRMNGIQIGLWNKIGKRGLPLINISFKKKELE